MKVNRIIIGDVVRDASVEFTCDAVCISPIYHMNMNQFIEYWENNLTNVFRRKKDILVADSVLEIFRRSENIENFNKKALYIMIREMSGSKTQHITRIVNTMKKYHFGLIAEFRDTGAIDTESTGSFL